MMKKLIVSLVALSFSGSVFATDIYCFKSKASPKDALKVEDIYGPNGHPEMWKVVELSIDLPKKAAKFSFRGDDERVPVSLRDCVGADCRAPGIRHTNLKFNREAEDRLVFQTEYSGGRVDVFTLFKDSGELRVGVWREIETEVRPDKTFRFKKAIEKKLALSHTSVFQCE